MEFLKKKVKFVSDFDDVMKNIDELSVSDVARIALTIDTHNIQCKTAAECEQWIDILQKLRLKFCALYENKCKTKEGECDCRNLLKIPSSPYTVLRDKITDIQSHIDELKLKSYGGRGQRKSCKRSKKSCKSRKSSRRKSSRRSKNKSKSRR